MEYFNHKIQLKIITLKWYAFCPGHIEFWGQHRFGNNIFKFIFLYKNCWSLIKIFWNLFQGSNLQLAIIGLDNGFEPSSQQAIIWTNYGLLRHLCKLNVMSTVKSPIKLKMQGNCISIFTKTKS